MKIWTCVSSPQSGSRNAGTRMKNVNAAIRLSKYWNFFGPIQMICCRHWWQWTKPVYVTMALRQSNTQSNGDLVSNSDPKMQRKKSAEELLASFFGIKTVSSSLIIFHRPKLLTRNIPHLCRCNWRIFWRKKGAGSLPSRSFSCTTMPRLTGQLQPRRMWPRSTTLLSGSGIVGLPSVP